jgi:hypothetical protein
MREGLDAVRPVERQAEIAQANRAAAGQVAPRGLPAGAWCAPSRS